MEDSESEIRKCARLILPNEAGKILLLRTIDQCGPEYWFTPGGGVEPGETLEQAGRREAAEELGLQNVGLNYLWSGHSRFMLSNRRVSQYESFFLITSYSGELGNGVEHVHRNEEILEMNWRDLDEIRKATDLVFPKDLASRLSKHLPHLSQP